MPENWSAAGELFSDLTLDVGVFSILFEFGIFLLLASFCSAGFASPSTPFDFFGSKTPPSLPCFGQNRFCSALSCLYLVKKAQAAIRRASVLPENYPMTRIPRPNQSDNRLTTACRTFDHCVLALSLGVSFECRDPLKIKLIFILK
jgi:hypothetical protein